MEGQLQGLYRENCDRNGRKPLADFVSGLGSTDGRVKLTRLLDEDTASVGQVLVHANNITDLDVSASGLTARGARGLSYGFKENMSIAALNLGGTNIGDEGVLIIAERLLENSACALTSLNLRSIGVTVHGLAAVMTAVARINVTYLNLQDNGIPRQGGLVIAEALRSNRKMTTLMLGSNNLGDAGAAAIGGALSAESEQKASLSVLDLSNNGIGDHGVEALVRGIDARREGSSESSALTALNLHGNVIGNRGASVLAAIISAQTTAFQELDLGANRIESEGVVVLSSALQNDHSLKVVNFQGVVLDLKGIHALASALRENSVLQQLDLDPVMTDGREAEQGLVDLASALASNTTLMRLSLGEFDGSTSDAARSISSTLALNERLASIGSRKNFDAGFERSFFEQDDDVEGVDGEEAEVSDTIPAAAETSQQVMQQSQTQPPPQQPAQMQMQVPQPQYERQQPALSPEPKSNGNHVSYVPSPALETSGIAFNCAQQLRDDHAAVYDTQRAELHRLRRQHDDAVGLLTNEVRRILPASQATSMVAGLGVLHQNFDSDLTAAEARIQTAEQARALVTEMRVIKMASELSNPGAQAQESHFEPGNGNSRANPANANENHQYPQTPGEQRITSSDLSRAVEQAVQQAKVQWDSEMDQRWEQFRYEMETKQHAALEQLQEQVRWVDEESIRGRVEEEARLTERMQVVNDQVSELSGRTEAIGGVKVAVEAIQTAVLHKTAVTDDLRAEVDNLKQHVRDLSHSVQSTFKVEQQHLVQALTQRVSDTVSQLETRMTEASAAAADAEAKMLQQHISGLGKKMRQELEQEQQAAVTAIEVNRHIDFSRLEDRFKEVNDRVAVLEKTVTEEQEHSLVALEAILKTSQTPKQPPLQIMPSPHSAPPEPSSSQRHQQQPPPQQPQQPPPPPPHVQQHHQQQYEHEQHQHEQQHHNQQLRQNQQHMPQYQQHIDSSSHGHQDYHQQNTPHTPHTPHFQQQPQQHHTHPRQHHQQSPFHHEHKPQHQHQQNQQRFPIRQRSSQQPPPLHY
jgi:Ran GTPase-activating protein (RanGAP) involved in mRNA processing and transport